MVFSLIKLSGFHSQLFSVNDRVNKVQPHNRQPPALPPTLDNNQNTTLFTVASKDLAKNFNCREYSIFAGSFAPYVLINSSSHAEGRLAHAVPHSLP